MLRGDNEMINDDKHLTKLFNENYISIAEQSSGFRPENVVRHNEDFDKKIILHNIIKKYENHFSISKIKNNLSVKSHLSSTNTLPSARQVTSNEVNLTLKSLHQKKLRYWGAAKGVNAPPTHTHTHTQTHTNTPHTHHFCRPE